MFKNQKETPEFEYFTIFDTKTGTYRDPTLALNRYDLLREIENIFKDPNRAAKAQIFLNAEDFQIFKVGEFSRRTGVITATPKEHICNLHDLKASVLRQSGQSTLSAASSVDITQ